MELFEQNVEWKRQEFAPLSFWAWNDEMNDGSIQMQIKEFHDQGFGGFFMHSRGGLLTPYLSDAWFDACRTAAKEARKYGMQAWIYDEDGWPSGFAGGRVNGLGEEYVSKHFEFFTSRPDDDKRIIAAYKKTGASYQRCEYSEAELWAVYELENDYADLLSSRVTKAFLNITYERYKEELGEYFGETVPGFFTDEPQFFRTGYPYSFELKDYFKIRNDYELEEGLYYLLPSFQDEKSRKFRLDFWNTIEEMMTENFSRQIFDWCDRNGVIFTGHYPGEDSLIHQMTSTAGVMPKYAYMQMPGIDHLGRRITSIILTKQVTSVAKQLGRKKVLSETFGCAGWDIPFEDLCYIWGWQASAGINVPVLHLGAYTMRGIRKRDYPAFYSYQEPWWKEFHHISDWLSGIGYLMAKGRWLEDVLVINPIQSIYCTHGTDQYFTDQERQIAASYRQLCDCLLDIEVGFDIGDEKVLRDYASASNGTLKVGNCSYRYIIIPRSVYLDEMTWSLLEEFYKSGGSVIFTDTIPSGKEKRKWVTQCPVVSNVRRFWLKYFASIHYHRKVSVYDQSGFYLASGLNVAVKKDGKILRAYIWNLQADSTRSLILKAEGKQRVFEVNPETLQRIEQMNTCFDGDGNTLFTFELSKKQSLLLEMEEGALKSSKNDWSESRQQIKGDFCRTEDNCLTIDYASFSLNGKDFSDRCPIVKLHPKLYRELGKRPTEFIHVRYEFDNRLSGIDSDLKVAVEERDCVDILCNQISVFHQRQGWYMDREFGLYAVGQQTVKGKNILELIYRMKQSEVKDTEGMFETEVNRFFYPVEPEAVYLLGDFNVSTADSYKKFLTHLRVKGESSVPEFYLEDSAKLHGMQDVTRQGLWFYRGNITQCLYITKMPGEKVLIEIKNPHAALVEVRCSEKTYAAYQPPYRIDLTENLRTGENKVELILYGTNRNLLGPHHHQKGENLFVGCNTFKGEKGYEDSLFYFDLGKDTWTDDYSFVPFGCDGVEIIRISE